MSEELSFEDELANLLSEAGDEFSALSGELEEAFESVDQPVKAEEPKPDKSKEKILSQAEIDALLASMVNQD